MTQDVFAQKGSAATPEARGERAQRAVKAFRGLQPGLSGFARALTGRKDVEVILSEGAPHTDGTKIFYKPPMALGDNLQHDRSLCDRRGADKLQRCLACRVREEVIISIIHEIAHIAFETFEKTTERAQNDALGRALEGGGTRWAEEIRKNWSRIPDAKKNDYLNLSGLVSPYLPLIVNGLEDARVDETMFKARKGTRAMFDAYIQSIFANGIEQDDGTVSEWRDRPLNSQAIIGIFVLASGYSFEGWFAPEVETALADKELRDLCRRVSTIRSAAGTYELSFPILARLRDLGFCRLPEEPDDPIQEPEPEPEPEPESEEDESEPEEGDSGEEDDESDADEGPDDPGEGDGSSDEPEDGEDSGSNPGSSESEENEDAEEGEGAGDSPGEDSRFEDGDSDSAGGGEPDGEPEPGESDRSGSDSTGEEPEVSEEASDGTDDPQSDDSGDESVEPGSDEDADGDDSGDDEVSGGAPGSSAGGDRDHEGEAGDPQEGEGEGGSEGSEAERDPEAGDDGPGPGEDDGEADLGEPDPGPVEAEDSLTNGRDEGVEDSGQPELDDDGSDEAVDSGADEGKGGTTIDTPDYGSFDEAINDIKAFGQHDLTVTPEDPKEKQEDDKALDIAIVQGQYFEKPSAHIAGVREHFYGKDTVDRNGKAWTKAWDYNYREKLKKKMGIDADLVVDESILGPALVQMRKTFAENLQAKFQHHLRSGRVNSRVLGRRAWSGDDRLFQKKRLPGKRSYAVLIGIDISGSTVGKNLALAKRAAMAQAEMCNRTGIDFAIYAHTANGDHAIENGFFVYHDLTLDMYEIKGFDQGWDDEAREALGAISSDSENLDGHGIEYYRKKIERHPATDKIILYYTDGKMPAANHDEELEILVREINYCRAKKITLLGVGIRTDSPRRHGLDTVEVRDDEDLVKVVRHLETALLHNR